MPRIHSRSRWLGLKAGMAVLRVKRWTKRVMRPVRAWRKAPRFWRLR